MYLAVYERPLTKSSDDNTIKQGDITIIIRDITSEQERTGEIPIENRNGGQVGLNKGQEHTGISVSL